MFKHPPTTVKEAEEQIESLKAPIKDAHDALYALIDKRNELLLRRHFFRTGLEIGALIQDKDGDVYRVSKIRNPDWDEPWVYGNYRKKDGSFSTRQTWVYRRFTVLKSEAGI